MNREELRERFQDEICERCDKVSDRIRLTDQLSVLREVAADYQGKTIDNIIQQMEARLDEVIKQETI